MQLSKLKAGKDRQGTWLCFCASVLFLTLFPAAGALGLVIILGIVWRSQYQTILRDYLNQALLVLTGILILSSALAKYPADAWLGLANFVPYFILFMALRCLITKPEQLKQLSWLIVFPSLPIVFLGLGQIWLAWDTPPLVKSILGWELIPLGVPPGRMSSVFNYTNFLAIYLAIAFILTLGLWLANWQRRSDRWKNLILLTVIVLADLSGLVLTSSRNAWGIAVLALMAYAFYLGWRWIVWSISGMAISILWAAFVPQAGGTHLRRVVPSFIWIRLSDRAYDRPVETLRLTQWQFCWDLIKDRPLFGWGLRNFTTLYEAKYNFWLGHPHSFWLMFGAEAGLAALLLLLAIIAKIMLRAVQALSTWCDQETKTIFYSYLLAFIASVVFNLADVTVFDLRVNTLIWIILAAISGVSSSQSPTKNP
ncbi:MAG: O-antigen ligase family protein [Cyanobacteria bacterium J06600_6]